MQSSSFGDGPTHKAIPQAAGSRPEESAPVVVLPLCDLLLDLSPRLDGGREEHARMLAETDAALPPILVHRQTMRVIDGMHRVRAARMRGQETIRAQFYEGSESAAFVLAVRRNIAHGLPLSTADRKAAAERIVVSHPHWSDRTIAASTGLSARTVQCLRQRSIAEIPQLNGRTGQDGRFRPINIAEGRLRASEFIRAQPSASLRTVAKAAGVSLGTAHDVRERLRRGDDPVPAGHRRPESRPAPHKPRRPARPVGHRELRVILETLQRDPSMKFSGSGRHTLRWLWAHAVVDPGDYERLLEGVPAHCTDAVAELAWAVADTWQEIAQKIAQHERMTG